MKLKTILASIAISLGVVLFVTAPSFSLTSGHITTHNIAFAQTTPAATTPSTTPPAPDTTSGCGVTSPSACIRWLVVLPFTGLVKLGTLVLTLVGNLFDILVDHTIITFKTSVYASIATAVETTWTVFRDISNILIIGMFTFIAICIILGVEKYGQKKLVANVLIIAVLINFSLLFTEVIIDGSNFTATQFYNSMGILHTGPSAGPSNVGTTGAGSADIAGAFMQAMGVGTLGDTQNALDQIAGDKGIAAMMTTALLTFIFFIAAAAVLGYGCFILISRAILLVFLLITSSLAFATHLIPSLESKGWSAWWSALISSTVLAPMFMLFLWATLKVANALHSTGSLGVIISNPSDASSFTILFNYIIVLGLLYTSFRIASSFSASISGIGFLNNALAKMSGGVLASSAAVTALGLQRKVGRGALQKESEYNKESKNLALQLANLDQGSALHTQKLQEFEAMQKKAAAASARSKQDFNLMNTALGKSIAQKTGIGNLGQTATGGAAAEAKKIAEDAAKASAGLSVNKEDAAKSAQAMMDSQREALSAQKQAAEEMAKTSKEAAEEIMKSEDLEGKKTTAENNVKTVRLESENNSTKHKDEMKALANELSKHPPTSPEAIDIKAKIDTQNAQRKTELDKEGERIKAAQGKVEEIQKHIVEVNKPFEDAKTRAGAIENDIVEFDKTAKARTEAHAAKIVEQSKGNVAMAAEIHARHHGADDHIAQMARETSVKSIKNKSVRERLKAQMAAQKELQDDVGVVPDKPDTGLPPKT